MLLVEDMGLSWVSRDTASQALLSSTLIVDDFTMVVKSIILFFALSSILVGVTYQQTQKNQFFRVYHINTHRHIKRIIYSVIVRLN